MPRTYFRIDHHIEQQCDRPEKKIVHMYTDGIHRSSNMYISAVALQQQWFGHSRLSSWVGFRNGDVIPESVTATCCKSASCQKYTHFKSRSPKKEEQSYECGFWLHVLMPRCTSNGISPTDFEPMGLSMVPPSQLTPVCGSISCSSSSKWRCDSWSVCLSIVLVVGSRTHAQPAQEFSPQSNSITLHSFSSARWSQFLYG